MRPKVIILLCVLFWLGACGNDSALPTQVPTAVPLSLPPLTNTPSTPEIEPATPNAINTPESTLSDADEVEAILQEIDLEVCQEVFETQAELGALQAQGKDVTELSTAVAELAVELEDCASLLTPTPTP